MEMNKVDVLRLSLAHSLNHSLLLALPPIIPLIVKDTGLSYGLVGLMATSAYLAYGFGAILASLSARFLGLSKTVSISLIVPGLSTILIAVSPSALSLSISLLLIGGLGSLYHPSVNSLISKSYSMKLVPRVMGLHGAGGNLGQVMTPFLSAWIGLTFGWKYSLLVFGITALLTGFTFINVGSDEDLKNARVKWVKEKFVEKSFLMLLVFTFLQGLYYRGVELFTPSFLNEVKELDLSLAGLIASMVMGLGVIGQYVGGRLSTWIKEKNVMLMSVILSLLGLIFIQFLPGVISGILFSLAYGIGFYMNQPAANTYIARHTSIKVRDSAYSVFYTVAFTSGSLSSLYTSILVSVFGLDLIFIPMIIIAPISLIPLIFLSD